MRKYFILFLLIGLMKDVSSQNLINNPNFEDYKKRPRWIIKVKHLKDCYNPSRATPDILTPYSKNTWYSAPKNCGGFQIAHSGDSYIGLTIYTGEKYVAYNNNNEYLTIKLKEPLKENKLYCISAYVSLADTCFYASENIGVYLSPTVPKSDYQGTGTLIINKDIKFNSQVIQYPINYNISKDIIKDKNNWTLICDTIRTVGGENYITIGNFKKSSETKFVEVKKSKPNITDDRQTAYYYFDDVSLVEITNPSECKCKESIKVDTTIPLELFNSSTIKKDSAIILSNLYFETNKSELLIKSDFELDKLFKMLDDNPQFAIEISGHTDNTGMEDHNKQLSEDRAKAVVDYLVVKGISKDRLSYKGYGSTKPIADNLTEEGRAKNRRVEFIIEIK